MSTNDIKFFKRHHSAWVKLNPQGTLLDLLTHLEAALDECENYGDELICEYREDVCEELAHELDQWTIEDDETFSWRYEDIAEMIDDVQALIEERGERQIVAKLRARPAKKRRKTAA